MINNRPNQIAIFTSNQTKMQKNSKPFVILKFILIEKLK